MKRKHYSNESTITQTEENTNTQTEFSTDEGFANSTQNEDSMARLKNSKIANKTFMNPGVSIDKAGTSVVKPGPKTQD